MRPTHFIVENVIHDALDSIERCEPADKVDDVLAKTSERECNALASLMLAQIAGNAAPAVVFKALEAVNGPTSNQQIRTMLLGALEARKVERNPSYVPPA